MLSIDSTDFYDKMDRDIVYILALTVDVEKQLGVKNQVDTSIKWPECGFPL